MSADREAIRVASVAVWYGATRALAGVDLGVDAGSVHAVVGENGAGKSTLLRVLTGQVSPRAGTVHMLGHTRAPTGPAEAERWGVALAPQEIDLCEGFRVFEQVTLGREPRRPGALGRLGFVDRDAQITRTRELLARLGARDIDPRAPLESLGASRQKQVQIARALASHPRILLLDEPTAALDAPGQAGIRQLLAEHSANGGAAVLISHRIDEVLELADTVTILRDGEHVRTARTRDLDAAQVVRDMVGRDVALSRAAGGVPRRRSTSDPPRIELAGAGLQITPVRGGEIVGLAGLVGAGRSRLLEGIARADPAGVALVPEERQIKGLIPTFRVRENLFVHAPTAFVSAPAERARARRFIEDLGIRTAGADAPIQSLSGGNQQKVLLARALARGTDRILLDEPTQGVDVGAKADIHDAIRALAEGGTAVLIASSDLAELLELTDRIVVMRDGAAVAEVATGDATESKLIGLAAGVGAR